MTSDARITEPDVFRVERLELGQHLQDYQSTWDLQRRLHEQISTGAQPDTALLLEHAEVFTAGRRTQPQDLPVDGSAVIEVDRGGRITWHGPGQLVCYPIVRLPQPFDVVAHVRRLEQIIIDTCADLGLATIRVEGRSGVWVQPPLGSPMKVAAIGVRVARGVTMHGLSVNADCDLSWAQQIVPCGLADATTTSLSEQLGRDVTVLEVAEVLEPHLYDTFAVRRSA